MPGKRSIIEIAREAGVSPSTVSRVLNNHPDVSPETYRAVKAVIDRLGFLPNAAARSLVSKRSRMLAFVTSEIAFYPTLILAQVEEQARQRGYKLFVNVINSALNPPSAQDDRILEDLLSYQVDGIIWAVAETTHSFDLWRARLASLRVPIVCISTRAIDALTFVSVDNRRGGHLVAQHFLAQGYRHLGTITGPMYELSALERHAGWQEVLQQAGLPPAPQQVVEGDWTPAGGERAFLELYEQFPQVDAVFVHNDQMAVGVLSATHRLGLRVPEQVGVAGFDNRSETAFLLPPLTSVSHHFEEIGLHAVAEIDRLIQLSAEDRALEQTKGIWIQPELVVRESSMRSEKGGATGSTA